MKLLATMFRWLCAALALHGNTLFAGDPALAVSLGYSVLLGADDDIEFGLRVAVDAAGSAYVVSTGGKTNGTHLDVIVTRLSPDGKTILYRVAVGGSGAELAGGIALDLDGNAYVTGMTDSSDFPSKSGIQFRRYGDTDAFVAKLNPAGQVVYATLIGGQDNEQAKGIAVDRFGAAYVTGLTSSRDFLVPNVKDAPVPPRTFQTRLIGASDAFVVKINPQGTAFEFKTFLGGSAAEAGVAIAVDDAPSCYVFGVTSSLNFPTKNPAQPDAAGGIDSFIVKFIPTGAALEFATYLGGPANEVFDFATPLIAAGNIAVDPEHNVYVASDQGGGADGFVVKLAPDGSEVRYTSILGGTHGDSVYGLAIQPGGKVAVTGGTFSPNFPVSTDALQAKLEGENDAFATWLGADGSVEYSTFLGGTGADFANGIAAGPEGSVYIAGITGSTNFPITTAAPATRRVAYVTRLQRGTQGSLRFESVRLNEKNDFVMSIVAAPSPTKRYHLESSINMRDWLLVTDFTTPLGRFEFVDPRRPEEVNRFYRARSP